jgi:hypothetical protein
MATENDDIILDQDGEDLVDNGDFVVDDGKLDDCLIILKTNKGEVKSDPMLGPNLIKMMNANVTTTDLKQEILLNLKMDSKEPKKLDIKDGNIDLSI